jgi:hypothetical protein
MCDCDCNKERVQPKPMREHLLKAKQAVTSWDAITVDGNKVSFTVQDGPILEAGLNGVQVTDMLEYVRELFSYLNAELPCRENALTITHIDEALNWQRCRTINRQKGNVEDTNQA